MTSHMQNNQDKNKSQAGVSLMLAVLVLAGITAIAFSVAAIVFTEIRSSGDLLRTEPALYAVQSVTEEAFYSTTRDVTNFPFSTSINNVTLTTAQRSFDPSPQAYVVYYNTDTKFSLADSANPFRNAYTTVKIDYVSPISGVTVNVDVYQYQDTGNNGVVDTRQLTTLSPSWTINFANYSNAANSEFEIVLNTSSPNNSTVLITSARNGTPPSGLPLIGRAAYDVTASYLGLTRKYTVSVPTNNGPSGGPGSGDGKDEGGGKEGAGFGVTEGAIEGF